MIGFTVSNRRGEQLAWFRCVLDAFDFGRSVGCEVVVDRDDGVRMGKVERFDWGRLWSEGRRAV